MYKIKGKCKFKIKPSVLKGGNCIAINLLLLFFFCWSGYKSGKRRMPQNIVICLLQSRLLNKASRGLKDHESWKWFAGSSFAPYVPAVEVPTKCAEAMICCQDEGWYSSAFQQLCWGKWLQNLQNLLVFLYVGNAELVELASQPSKKGERHQRQ